MASSERIAPHHIRHSAQTVFGIIILGVGPVLAGAYNQWLDRFAMASEGGTDWQKLWMVQASIGLAAAMIIAIAFRPGLEQQTE